MAICRCSRSLSQNDSTASRMIREAAMEISKRAQQEGFMASAGVRHHAIALIPQAFGLLGSWVTSRMDVPVASLQKQRLDRNDRLFIQGPVGSSRAGRAETVSRALTARSAASRRWIAVRPVRPEARAKPRRAAKAATSLRPVCAEMFDHPVGHQPDPRIRGCLSSPCGRALCALFPIQPDLAFVGSRSASCRRKRLLPDPDGR